MNKRITALLLALIVLLALPSSALAHFQAGTALNIWEGNNANGYSYWVAVCDRDMAEGAEEARIQDAVNEWNEIGGELFFNYAPNMTGAECEDAYDNLFSNWVMVYKANFTDNTLGATYRTMIPFTNQVDDCRIAIDNNGTLSTWGSYTWYTSTGSPGANQVDLESVLVHEFGHCVSIWGHSDHDGGYVMHCVLNPWPDDCDPKNPKGIEKDEASTHDRAGYEALYGDTH